MLVVGKYIIIIIENIYMMSIYTIFLVNNIPLSSTPKEISNLINEYVFGNKIQLMQRNHFGKIMKIIKNVDSYSFKRMYIHLDFIYANEPICLTIYVKCPNSNKRKYDIAMDLMICCSCGNYVECHNVEIQDIPFHSKCNC